jgi:acetate kinase
MKVLVVNAGSSSLKLTLLGAHERPLAEEELATYGPRVDEELVRALGGRFAGAEAVGHRIVHGGGEYIGAVRLDATVTKRLRALGDLAPLHQQKALDALDAVSAELADVPAVACFDTAFHAEMPAAASTYALPRSWRERWPIRRYGFHGLSHAWVAERAPKILREHAHRAGEGDALATADGQRGEHALRMVSCHLGSGASLCAIAGGKSIETTMGFTPLEGLVMGTRSGSVDPGLVLWLLERVGLSERELAGALERESGLMGLAGTADMREVLAGAAAGEPDALLALAVYAHRLCAGIASMAAALGGVDLLAFTGGVGERSPEVRRLASDPLRFLGIELDEALNGLPGGDRVISAPEAKVASVVLRAREDLEIARQVRALLAP